MSDSDTTPQRVENLEFKLMELENTVAELNQVIIDQYREIDQLKNAQIQLANLLESVQKNPQSDDSMPSNSEIPPHY